MIAQGAMDASVRKAIARIDLIDNDTDAVVRRGTGCLVGEKVVLTALHVIADQTTPPIFHPGQILLTFPTHSTTATVLEGKWDTREDWVLLAIDTPAQATSLRLARLGPNSRDQWETYGFPDAQPGDGMTCAGTVRNAAGALDGMHVQQLFCHEAAAGNGMPVSGLSGAPVLVNGFVVGVLRYALLTNQTNAHTGRLEKINVAGTIYACPASRIAVRCPDYFPERLPTVSSLSSTRDAGRGSVRALGSLVSTVVVSLLVTVSVLVLAEITLGWTFESSDLSWILLVVISLTIGAAKLRSRRALRNANAGQ